MQEMFSPWKEDYFFSSKISLCRRKIKGHIDGEDGTIFYGP